MKSPHHKNEMLEFKSFSDIQPDIKGDEVGNHVTTELQHRLKPRARTYKEIETLAEKVSKDLDHHPD